VPDPSRLTEAMPSRFKPVLADLPASRSETTAPTAKSSAIGTKASPARVGEKPSTCCMYREVTRRARRG
jgi:hypothetical protein